MIIASGKTNSPTKLVSSASPVSIIAVAATFVGTYTVDDNSGSLRITSAGAHGLTAAVAVGKMIKLTGANLTDPTGLGLYTITAIDSDTTGVAITVSESYGATKTVTAVTLADTEVTLYSYSLAAGAMGLNGTLDIGVIASCPNNANVKTLKVKFGTIVNSIALASAATYRNTVSIQNRASQSAQLCTTTNTFGTSTVALATGTEDTTAAVTIAITAQPATANDYIQLESKTLWLTK